MKLFSTFLFAIGTTCIFSSVYSLEPDNFSEPIYDKSGFLYVSNDSHLSQKSSKDSTEQGTRFVANDIIPNYVQNILQFLKSNISNGLVDGLFENVSNNNCKAHVMEWAFRLGDFSNKTNILTEKDEWAIQMSDAWGKLPEGILTGHVNAIGDYHECVNIEVSDLTVHNKYFQDNISTKFEGQYCTSFIIEYNMAKGALQDMLNGKQLTQKNLQVRSRDSSGRSVATRAALSPEELMTTILTQDFGMIMMMPTIATCWPSSCSQVDVQVILLNSLNITYTLAFGEDMPSFLPGPVTAACQVKKKPDFDTATISVIALLSIITTLCVGSGVVDYFMNHDVGKPPQRGLAYQYLMAFSLYTNTKKWMSTRKSADDMGCIHGIRFLSTAWVVLGHTYFSFLSGPIWNYIDIKNMHKSWTVLAVINATFSVDTFFVMSGLLACYGILKVLQKTSGKLNVLQFYIHRYVRLTPTYAILVGIVATLYSYLSSGPNWMNIVKTENNCRKNWWTNILYVNNLVGTDAMCNGESWYLANDMQFYILSPLIVYPMWKWEKVGFSLLSVYTALSIIAPILVVHVTNSPYAMIVTGPMGFDFNEIYIRPWSRIQTFLVGIWVGWLLFKMKGRQLRIPRAVTLLLWLISAALAMTVIFAIQPWFDPKHKIRTVSGYMYAGLSRFTWGVVIAWIIFACVKGHGGFISRFLSWKPFMPLGRLCFCVYLVSLHLQDLFHSRLATPMRYDSYTMVNLFFAHMVMSCLVGFICTLLFESPFIVLQKLIFEGGSTSSTSNPQERLARTVDQTAAAKENNCA